MDSANKQSFSANKQSFSANKQSTAEINLLPRILFICGGITIAGLIIFLSTRDNNYGSGETLGGNPSSQSAVLNPYYSNIQGTKNAPTLNTNMKMPTPKPSPSPKNVDEESPSPLPTPSPEPSQTPTVSPSPTDENQIIEESPTPEPTP